MMKEFIGEQTYSALRELYEGDNGAVDEGFDRLLDLFVVCALSNESIVSKVAAEMKKIHNGTSRLVAECNRVWHLPEYREAIEYWIESGLAKPYDEAMARLLSV